MQKDEVLQQTMTQGFGLGPGPPSSEDTNPTHYLLPKPPPGHACVFMPGGLYLCVSDSVVQSIVENFLKHTNNVTTTENTATNPRINPCQLLPFPQNTYTQSSQNILANDPNLSFQQNISNTTIIDSAMTSPRIFQESFNIQHDNASNSTSPNLTNQQQRFPSSNNNHSTNSQPQTASASNTNAKNLYHTNFLNYCYKQIEIKESYLKTQCNPDDSEIFENFMRFIIKLRQSAGYQSTCPKSSLHFFLNPQEDEGNDTKVLERFRRYCEKELSKPSIDQRREGFLRDKLNSLFEIVNGSFVQRESVIRIRNIIREVLRDDKTQKKLKGEIKNGKCKEKMMEFCKKMDAEFGLTLMNI